jgi:tight adherence protein C
MTAQLLIGFFFFILTAVGAAGYIFVLRPSRAGGGEIPTQIGLDQPDMPSAQAAVVDMFRLIGEAMPGSQQQAAHAWQQLVLAGYRWPSAISIFVGIKCACALVLAIAATSITFSFRPDVLSALIPALCGLGFGYMLPDRVLDRMVRHRIDRLRRGLPAALDLLVLSIEAGQGLDAAILDASRGLRISHPELAAEFTQLQLELKTNAIRVDALRNFSARCHDIELRKFANLLIDTDRFGTSLGPALRNHSRYIRIRFRQVAQEKARKVGVKLIFPVFFLIFPSVILVTLGPAVVLIFQQMTSLLAQ